MGEQGEQEDRGSEWGTGGRMGGQVRETGGGHVGGGRGTGGRTAVFSAEYSLRRLSWTSIAL